MLNQVNLIGRLGKDPEIRTTKTNDKMAAFTLATFEKWKDKEGQKKEKTQWHSVVVFGHLVDVVERYVKKGDLIYVQGKLQTRKWLDNDGQDRYNTEVILDVQGALKMLGSKSTAQTAQANNNYTSEQYKNKALLDTTDDVPF